MDINNYDHLQKLLWVQERKDRKHLPGIVNALIMVANITEACSF